MHVGREGALSQRTHSTGQTGESLTLCAVRRASMERESGMSEQGHQTRGAGVRTAVVARAIAEEARAREDWAEAERFERIAALAEARVNDALVLESGGIAVAR